MTLALFASLSLMLLQVTPTFAAGPGTGGLLDQARHGAVAMISPDQMAQLASKQPKLHAKLMNAYRDQVAPDLTATERSLVRALTLANIKKIKAGQASTGQAPSAPGTAVTVQKAPDLSSAITYCVSAGTTALAFLGPFAVVVAILGCLLVIPLAAAFLGLQAAAAPE